MKIATDLPVKLSLIIKLILLSLIVKTNSKSGSRVDVFINNIFDKLCEFIRSKHPELDIANATNTNQINSLRSLSTSNTVNIAMNCIEPDKECSSQADSLTHDSQYSEQMNVEEESVNEEVAFCPFWNMRLQWRESTA